MATAGIEQAQGLRGVLVVAGAPLPSAALPDHEPLTLAEAAELTARIGQTLDHAELLIARAYLGRVWEPLGLVSWNAWVDRHFGDRPILCVPRQDRPDVVQDLSDAGLSGRAIARAIGVAESTVRRDLAEAGGAPNDAPDGGVACPTCGESHPAEVGTCPHLENAFGLITANELGDGDSGVEPGIYGPGTRSGATTIDADTDEPLDDLNDADETDSDDDPLPDDDDEGFLRPDAEAARRAARLRRAVDRIVVVRDDLDELPDLIDGIIRDARDWPPTALTPDPGLAAQFRCALAGLDRAAREWPGWLESCGTAVNALGAYS